MFGRQLVRLPLRAVGGQGQPYGDETVAEVRALVEETRLSQKQIGAIVGVSPMTVCRWTRSGGWRRPPGTVLPIPEMPATPHSRDRRRIAFARPWRLLREAEATLAGLGQDGADLDRMERALALVLEARELHARGIGRKRGAR